jgi:hypothetical protein
MRKSPNEPSTRAKRSKPIRWSGQPQIRQSYQGNRRSVLHNSKRIKAYIRLIREIMSLSVITRSRVISFSDVQLLSAMVISSSSLNIRSAFLTPALPSTARANSTGLPIWQRTRWTHDAVHVKQMFTHFLVRVIQQRTYKYSWSSQRQGLEHVSATADAAVKEHRHTALCFSYNLKFSLPRQVSIKAWTRGILGSCANVPVIDLHTSFRQLMVAGR